MRIKLNLQANNNAFLTSAYQYPLSAAIYKLLQFGSSEFSEFLHSKGYRIEGKKYKLFTFALRFKKIRFINNSIQLLTPEATLYISSPLVDQFIQNFVIGTFEKQTIDIVGSNIKAQFRITGIESLPDPDFINKTKFKLLSPLVVSTKYQMEEKFMQHYLTWNEDIKEINRIINNNLRNKFQLIHNREYTGSNIIFSWNEQYIKKHIWNPKSLTRLITVEKKNIPPVKIRANKIPFSVEGDTELIKVGYDCGFGEKNSLGCGMVEII